MSTKHIVISLVLALSLIGAALALTGSNLDEQTVLQSCQNANSSQQACCSDSDSACTCECESCDCANCCESDCSCCQDKCDGCKSDCCDKCKGNSCCKA